jgi:hypothetical protein
MNTRQLKRYKNNQSLVRLKFLVHGEIQALMKRFPYRRIEDLIAYHMVRSDQVIVTKMMSTYLKQLPVPRRIRNG